MNLDEWHDIGVIVSVVKLEAPPEAAWKRGFLSAFSFYGARSEAGRLLARSYSWNLGYTSSPHLGYEG